MAAEENYSARNPEYIRGFLEIYKSHPCLWDMNDKNYTQRHVKQRAYQELVEYSKLHQIKNANVDFVRRKIFALRGCFRKEYCKVKRSVEEGATGDNIYKPKLWYYDLMLFTADQKRIKMSKQTNKPTNDIVIEETSMEEESYDQISEEYYDVEDETVILVPMSSDEVQELEVKIEKQNILPPDIYLDQSVGKPKSNKENNEAGCNVVSTSTASLLPEESIFEDISPDSIDEWELLSMDIISKMKKMDSEQRLYAENLIRRTLYYGMLKKLQPESDIILHPE